MNHFTTNMSENYVQQMYQNAMGPKHSNEVKDTKNLYKKNETKNPVDQKETKEEEAAVYEGSTGKTEKAVTYQKPKVAKQNDLQTKLSETYEKLSDEAKNYLDELKAKYGDIEFFVADCASDDEMNRYFAMGSKKYSCVISSDTIEQMATDTDIRAKYEAIIDGADEKLEEVKEEITEEFGEEAANQVERLGISIDDKGVVDYFVKLKKSNDSYYKKLQEKRAEERSEEKKAEKAEQQNRKSTIKNDSESVWVHANSKEDLITAIKEALGLSTKDQNITISKVVEDDKMVDGNKENTDK